MPFQIVALDGSAFAHLFTCSDRELHEQGARRQMVSECPGTPCRVSLEDAQIGETVILCNYVHQPAQSPYRASHGIFIRENVKRATPAVGVVPQLFRTRMISARAFDADHIMVDAWVGSGQELEGQISALFQSPETAYLHLHYAAPGCFAALVERA